jgi:CHAT domain-containing protein/Tfp pilus assembly protein PilF
MLQTHGFLSRAQLQCDLTYQSQNMLAAAKQCFGRVAKPNAELALRKGMERFDVLQAEKGKEALCNEIIRTFPGVFGDDQFLDLERMYRSVQSLLKQGKYTDAYQLAVRLESEARVRTKGQKLPIYADALRALGILQMELGKYQDAAQSQLKLLELDEAIYGNSQTVAQSLNNLAETYQRLDRARDAEPLFRRALSMHEKFSDPESVAETTLNLANVLAKLRKFAEAEELYKKTLSVLGPDNDYRVAMIYRNLGQMAEDRRDRDKARQNYKNAIAIYRARGLESHPDHAATLELLGDTYLQDKQYGEAQLWFERALAIYEPTLGIDNPQTAALLDKLGTVYFFRAKLDTPGTFAQQLPGYLDMRRKATKAALLSSRKNLSVDDADADLALERSVFSKHLDALYVSKLFNVGDKLALDREGFEIAQLTSQSASAIALRQMSIRLSRQNEQLDAIIRNRQERIAQRTALRDALLAAVTQGDSPRAAAIRQQQDALEKDLLDLSQTIDRQFPDFARVSDPRPLSVERVQQLLQEDEALILVVPNVSLVHVFAVTGKTFQSYTVQNTTNLDDAAKAYVKRGEDEINVDAGAVSSFRKGLASEQNAAGQSFDLLYSFRLYNTLFGRLSDSVKSKRQFNIVTSGEFTSLPFHLLVTEKPAAAASAAEAYRNAAWIIRDHAIAILPSVNSLESLRIIAASTRSRKPLIGFANPKFGGGSANDQVAALGTRAYTDYWKGLGIEKSQLRSRLPQLPDTEFELREVAKSVGASNDSLYLGERASEKMVKLASLRDFEIVYFATHGLVAGDVSGVGQPSLALTIPAKADDFDDGLLTASEVAQLSMDADWVVLSACNTIAGDRPGAEALSGLARAFFYAGARALLVTHWAVESAAATRLTTVAFRKLAADRSLGRAEAIRQSMLDMLRDARDVHNSDPAVWGPFSIVGEGRMK